VKQTFAVSYRSLFQTEIAPLASSWDELVVALSQHRRAQRKEAGPCWSPIIPKGERRCNAAVAAITAFVLDVDDGLPFEAVAERLAGREWIAYSSWSHSPRHPHYHVVIRLPEPIPAAEWPNEYWRLHKEIGHSADMLPAPAHAYFLPQHPAGAAWFVARSTDAVVFGGTCNDRNMRVTAALAAYHRICEREGAR